MGKVKCAAAGASGSISIYFKATSNVIQANATSFVYSSTGPWNRSLRPLGRGLPWHRPSERPMKRRSSATLPRLRLSS